MGFVFVLSIYSVTRFVLKFSLHLRYYKDGDDEKGLGDDDSIESFG